MPDCIIADCDRQSSRLGSGHYARADLCTRCYSAWFSGVTLMEDVASGKLVPKLHGPLRKWADAAKTPVWRPGRNVSVREKACDKCGAIIHIRKSAKGRH